ncbi:MAG: 1-acyl-sn-glycerol-3-phosphate acyltransferase [Sphingobacteriaceae bacterium]|nr:1-acyl-sn-glycerol-3-phosphate acyltransferase [Sphingobacteriaceae bacterium]
MVFKLKRFWARIISIFSMLYPKIIYTSKRKHKFPKPCVIVPNHTSYLDILFSPFYIDHTAVYMGKNELLKIPLFKYFFMYLDIPVKNVKVLPMHTEHLKMQER